MMYIYDPEKIDELLEKIKDDDSVTLTGSQLRELAETIRKKGKGRKPIALDDDLFDCVVRRWQSGEITARAAMQELDLKPNTFYRRVKERYNDMEELSKELKRAAREEKAELKELRKQVKAEAREAKEAMKDKAEETISAHKMEKEIHKEKVAAKLDHKKEVRELRRTVEPMAESAGLSKTFVGIILVPLIGNAAEHSSAVIMALKDKMNAAIEIALGSSLQIILFVIPVLTLLSLFFTPMSIVFTPFELVAVTGSVLIANRVASDGESNWLEGLQLVTVYIMIGAAFFFV